jgi:predicted dehydrogenase
MSQSAPVRIGIIGAGGFMRTHMDSFAEFPEAEIVAFCRRNETLLNEAADAYGIEHRFTDYRDMLKMDGLDAVAIITPTGSHRQISLDAIAAGKHVLCEKPLALVASDAKEMLDAAKAAGVVHATNFNQRGRTPVGRMKQHMDSGYIGQLFHANIWWGQTQAVEDKPEVASWRFKAEDGGGPVYELIHVFDMARLIGGEIKRVCALLTTSVPHRSFPDGEEVDVDVPDSGGYLLEWVNGGYAVVHTSFVSKGGDADGRTNPRIEISGSEGRLENDGITGIKGISGVSGPIQNVELGPEYPQPYRQFVDAILNGTPVRTSFYDGMKAAEIVDAAFLSSKEDRWVDLN